MSKKTGASPSLSLNRLNEEDEREAAAAAAVAKGLTEGSGGLENIDESGEILMTEAQDNSRELAAEQAKLRESINSVFKAVPVCEPPLFTVLIDNDTKRVEYLEQVLINRLIYNDLINEMRNDTSKKESPLAATSGGSVAEYASYLASVFNTKSLLNEPSNVYSKSSQSSDTDFLAMAEKCLFLSNLFLNNESLEYFKIEDLMSDEETTSNDASVAKPSSRVYSPEERFNFISNIKNITFVCLTKNNLRQMPVSLVSIFTNLEIIDLSENQFESIDLISLCSFNKLKEVNLSSNLLKHFKPTLVTEAASKTKTDDQSFFLTRQAAVSSARYDFDEAETTPEFREHLRALSKTLFVTVERLNLANNDLASVDSTIVSQFRNLKYLDLSNNNYQIGSDAHMPWQLMSNELRNLVELNLARNNKGGVAAVDSDDASNNRPVSMARRDSAQTLNSGRMSASAAPVIKMFSSLANLRVLNLSENNLKNMPKDIRELRHLEQLDLSKNSMEFLPTELTSLRSLKVLLLR
jgi:Leucine-rich repeat (LRR) protein